MQEEKLEQLFKASIKWNTCYNEIEYFLKTIFLNYYENKKTQLMNACIAFAAICLFGIMQSCTKDDFMSDPFYEPTAEVSVEPTVNISGDFLDIKSDVEYSNTEYFNILDEARNRMNPYTVIENDRFVLKITSGIALY